MRRTRRTWIRKTALALILVMTAVACSRGDSIGDVADPPPPAPIVPVLRRPGPPGDAQVGNPTVLGGMVLARNPIVRTELWMDSELIEASDLENPATEVRTGWYWAPPSAGLFGLVLRAIDDQGELATSFPLWIRAVEPEGLPAGAADGTSQVPAALPGVQMKLVAAQTDQPAPLQPIPLDALLGVDFGSPGLPNPKVRETDCQATFTLPAVQGAEGIAVYAASFGSPGFVPVGVLPPKGGEVSLTLGAAPVMVFAEAFGSNKRNPGPPNILVPPSPCALRGWTGDLSFKQGILNNPKGADRAYLYMRSGDAGAWNRIPAQDQTFVYPRRDGGFDFGSLLPPTSKATSFEAWGWVNGALVPLGSGSWKAPDPPGGTGGVSIPAGDIVVAPYGGPLMMPSAFDWNLGTAAGGNDPILIKNGVICTYPPQPPVAPITTAVPVSVVGGTASQTTTTTQAAIALLPDSCTNAPFGQYSEIFRWKPLWKSITHGILQVSTKPPPEDSALTFPGLVYTKSVAKAATDDFVDFEVPLGDLINPPSQSATKLGWEQMGFDMVLNLAEIPGGDSQSGGTYSFVPPELINQMKMTTFYLRVIPLLEAQPTSGASNAVVIKIDDTPPPTQPPPPPSSPSISAVIQMTPPHVPNPAYQRCVRVVDNPFGSQNPVPAETIAWQWQNPELAKALAVEIQTSQHFKIFYLSAQQSAFIFENGVKVHKGLVPGATVCATYVQPPEKDWWDYVVDAVNFVGWVWDLYVSVWDMMKGWVADVLAYATGCVTLAKATGKSTAAAEEFCSGLAKSAINYALIAYGVPPTMPKFKDLVEMGKGEIKEWVIKTATDQGILDCSVLQAACDKLAEELVDQMLDQMQVAASQAAVQGAVSGSQWLLKIHPGIYVIPEPAGTMSPAIFDVTITRSSDFNSPPPPATCQLEGWVWGDKAHYEWMNYHKGQWQTGPVTNIYVMKPKKVTVDLSHLKPGESTKAVVVLDEIGEWYPDGQNPALPKVPWNVKPKTWIFFQDWGGPVKSPTTLTTTLFGCVGAQQVHPQDSLDTEPWEIP